MGIRFQLGRYYHQLKTFRKHLPGLVVFAYRGILVVFFYLIFYKYFRYQPIIHYAYEYITHYLTWLLLFISHNFIELLGYDVQWQGKVIRIADSGGVLLDRGCLGRNLLLLFAGFLVIYPGRWKPKLWFIPLGVVLVFLINVIRISGLTVISYESPENLDINHDVFFQYSVYGLTFLLWVIYINKLSKPSPKRSNDKTYA